METATALEVMRAGMQIVDEAQVPTVLTMGAPPKYVHPTWKRLACLREQATDISPDEAREALIVADYVNCEVLGASHPIELSKTVEQASWLRQENPYVIANIGRFAVAMHRADKISLLDLDELDMHDVLTHFTGQYLATSALLKHGAGTLREHDPALYMSTEHIAKFRAQYPNVEPIIFRTIIGYFRRRIPLIGGALKYAESHPDLKAYQLTKHFRQQIASGYS